MFILKIIFFIILLPLRIFFAIVNRFFFGGIAYIPDDHPDMIKAIDEAHASLGHFRKLLLNPEPSMNEFGLKVQLEHDDGVEHCWAGSLEVTENGFQGVLTNEPQNATQYSLGSSVKIPEEIISDWAYAVDGVYQGHFTTKVLLPTLSKKVRRQVEEIYGWDTGQMTNT